jgi:SSS family solute:Na+ symporter
MPPVAPVHPTLAAFGTADWVVLGCYFALMIFVGFYVGRRRQGAEDYFLGGRSMPTWALAISIVGTSLSAATFVGVPDLSYGGNLTYLALNVGGFLAVLVVATLFVPKLYNAGTVTVYGYLGKRYGDGAMIAVSCVFLVGRMLASGARLFIAAIPLGLLVFGGDAVEAGGNWVPAKWQMVSAICLIGLIGTFYTVAGGIRAVIWIDVIQFAIVVGAALLSVGLLLHKIPLDLGGIFGLLADPASGPNGHSKLQVFDATPDPTRPFTIWAAVFGATFLNAAAYGTDQDLAQRFLVAKSASRGALSLLGAQFISMAVVSCFLLIGLLLFVFYKTDAMGAARPALPPGKIGVYPWFLMRELPPVLSGLAIAGFFAIAQGSMDSAINAMASSAVADLYWPIRRRLGHAVDPNRSDDAPKVAVALMGVLMTGFAVLAVGLYDREKQTLIDFALGVLTFAFAGMLGVFLAALLTRRGNSASVAAALVAGVLTVVLLQPAVLRWWSDALLGRELSMASTWWMPIGTSVAFLVCVLGRPAVSPPPTRAGQV